MQMERIILLLILCVSCGKTDGQPVDVCKPQKIAIAECIVEEFEKNPNRLMIDYQRQYCERLYSINMCYYK